MSFPDFPGVVTAGTNIDDARAMADPANKDGMAFLVSVKAEARKAVRVNVTLSADVLRQIDAFAEARGYTRSAFLAKAPIQAIERGPGAARGSRSGTLPIKANRTSRKIRDVRFYWSE